MHVGANPQGMALDLGTHTLYVTNERGADVAVVAAARCSALDKSGCRVKPASVSVEAPGTVAVSERTGTAYVVSGENKVAMIDTTTCNAYRRAGCRIAPSMVTVGDIPQGVTVDDSTHTAYVANRGRQDETGTVTVLDTLTCNSGTPNCRPKATLRIPGGHPNDVVVNSRTGTVYVMIVNLNGSNVIAAYDASRCNATTTTGCDQAPGIMRVTATAPCGNARMAIAVDRPTNTVYAADVSCGAPQVGDQVYVFNGRVCDAAHRTGCGDPVARVATGLNPYGIVVDEVTRTVFVALLGDGELAGSVALIDARTCNGSRPAGCSRPPDATPAGFGSALAGIDRITHQVVVTNVQEGTLSVIDGRYCRAGYTDGCVRQTATLPTDDYSYGVAVAHSVRTAYVASVVNGTVSVVGLSGVR